MAGLLGDIFSAGNVAKRKLTDLLGNPILSAQQMLGNLNDRARVLNEMTTAAAREGVSYGPSSQQLAGLLSEAYNPVGMSLYNTSNLPNRGRDLIQNDAEKLAELLKEKGFLAQVTHSGSVAGPSSYLNISDPQTGRFLQNQIRLSGHPKGVFNSQSVYDVTSDEFDSVLKAAEEMRAKGKTKVFLINEKADELISKGTKPKEAHKLAKQMIDEESSVNVTSPQMQQRIAPIPETSLENQNSMQGLLIASTEYKGSHTAPNAKTYGATLDDLTKIMPADVYGSQGKQLYGIGDPLIDSQWRIAALKAKGKPDAEIEVYRAVPKGVKEINSGDWVTTSPAYAKWHGENVLDGEYEIIKQKVKAKTLSTEGYPYEFGYNPFD